jgi:hypothetical protein
MAIKYLLPAALLGSNADDDYLRTVLKYGDTTQYTSHVRAAFDYGVKATFRTNGTRSTLEKELDDGLSCGLWYPSPRFSYTWKNWSKRWMVEGNGSGWYMTFRKLS